MHGSPYHTCLQRCALPRPALRHPHASIRARRPHLALLCRERGLRPRCRADLANARHPHVLALHARTQAACTRATSAQPLTCSPYAHYARAQRTLLWCSRELQRLRAAAQALLDEGLLTREELERAITTRVGSSRVSFHGGEELWVQGVLDLGVDPRRAHW
jgi:hypothetical protein